MNTLKSTAVILVLAGVLYGVYTALNKPPTAPPPGMTTRQVEEMAPPQIDFASGGSKSTSLPAPPSTLTLSSETHSPADLRSSSSGSTSIYSSAGSDTLTPPSTTPPNTTPPSDSTAQGPSYNRKSSYETPTHAAAPADAAAPKSSLTSYSFRRDVQQAEQQVNGGKFRAALATLTPYYAAADLAPAEREQLIAWLDALAAKVIYSREHLLDSPYVVRGHETLFDIAQQLHVPAELLQNINGVRDPRILLPNTELKVVPGPLRAEVNLTTSELTLFLGELYAGRFPFMLGNEPPQPGEYDVKDRQPDRTYIGADGRTIAANDPANPYGQCWIDLGPTACIHGSPLSAAPGTQTLGCISLSPQDAKDVYAILAKGSKVTVKR